MAEVNWVDVRVGANLRRIRNTRRVSRAGLVEPSGLTIAELAAIEGGTRRLRARELWRLSKVLGAPVSAFYQPLGSEGDCQWPIRRITAEVYGGRYGMSGQP